MMTGTITPYGIGGARSLDFLLTNGDEKPMAARFFAIETMVMADVLVIVGTSVIDIATIKRATIKRATMDRALMVGVQRSTGVSRLGRVRVAWRLNRCRRHSEG
jgi:hypothetical protein